MHNSGNCWQISFAPQFEASPLWEEFLEELRNNLLDCFRDEETYGFLKHDKRWQELTHIGCSR